MKYYEYAEGIIPDEIAKEFSKEFTNSFAGKLSEEKIAFYFEPLLRIMCDAISAHTENRKTTENGISLNVAFDNIKMQRSLTRKVKEFGLDDFTAQSSAREYVEYIEDTLKELFDTIDPNDFNYRYTEESIYWVKEFSKRMENFIFEFDLVELAELMDKEEATL